MFNYIRIIIFKASKQAAARYEINEKNTLRKTGL